MNGTKAWLGSLLPLLPLALACGTPDENGMGDLDDTGIQSASSSSTDGGDVTGDVTTDDGFKLDTMQDTDSESGSAEAGDSTCEKVDLLFVIDNSGSMEDEQVKLINNFPVFAQEIQTTLSEVDDYHVGVTSTDDYILAGLLGTQVNTDNPACQTMGALVTSTAAGSCAPYAEGGRYMTEQDDLETKFSCAGTLGTLGSGSEQVAGAMQAALSPAFNAPGACNEGFIRDDALLVIVLITDENDDVESQGDPADWFSTVSSYKFNEPDNIVVLSLIWDDSNGNPNGCAQGSDEEYGADLVAFTNMFTNGSVGNVCADSYQQFFHDAISVIDSACDGFVPPG